MLHDIRQPLQSLVLLHARLGKFVSEPEGQKIVGRIDAALETLTALLRGFDSIRPDAANFRRECETLEPDATLAATAAPASDAVSVPAAPDVSATPTICIVDDDGDVRAALRSVLEDDGHCVEDFASCEAFLASPSGNRDGCLLVDAYLPGMSGLELLRLLQGNGSRRAAIMITGASDVPMAVEAMKAGAIDFIEKPIGRVELLACLSRALEHSRDETTLHNSRVYAEERLSGLTVRQQEIMRLVLAGLPSKNIAADLGISQRTVENHRASIMRKTGAASIPALARLAMASASLSQNAA